MSVRPSDTERRYAVPTKALLSHLRVGLENFVRLAVALYTTPKERQVFEVMPGVSFNEADEPSWRLALPFVPPPRVSAKNCLALHEHSRTPKPQSQSCAWLQQTPVHDPTREDVWSPLLVHFDCVSGWPALASYMPSPDPECGAAATPQQDEALVQNLLRQALAQASEADPQTEERHAVARQAQFFTELNNHARAFATKRTGSCSGDGPPWPHTAMPWHLINSMVDDTLPGSTLAADARAVASWLLHMEALCEANCTSVLNELASATFPVAALSGPRGVMAHSYHCSRIATGAGALAFVKAAYRNFTPFDIALLQIATPLLPIAAAPLCAKTIRLILSSGTRSLSANDNVLAFAVALFGIFWGNRVAGSGASADRCAGDPAGPCCHRRICKAHWHRLCVTCTAQSECREHAESEAHVFQNQCAKCREFTQVCQVWAATRASLATIDLSVTIPHLAPVPEHDSQGNLLPLRDARSDAVPRADRREGQFFEALETACKLEDSPGISDTEAVLFPSAWTDMCDTTEDQILGAAVHFLSEHLKLETVGDGIMRMNPGATLCLPCTSSARSCTTCDTVRCSLPGLCRDHLALAALTAVATADSSLKGSAAAVRDVDTFEAEDIITRDAAMETQRATFVRLTRCAVVMHPAVLENVYSVLNAPTTGVEATLPVALGFKVTDDLDVNLAQLRSQISKVQDALFQIVLWSLNTKDWRVLRGRLWEHQTTLEAAVTRSEESYTAWLEACLADVSTASARRAHSCDSEKARRTVVREQSRVEELIEQHLAMTRAAFNQLAFLSIVRDDESRLPPPAGLPHVPTARNLRRIDPAALLELVAGPDAVPASPAHLLTSEAFRRFQHMHAAAAIPRVALQLRGDAAVASELPALGFVHAGSPIGFGCKDRGREWHWRYLNPVHNEQTWAYVCATAEACEPSLDVAGWSRAISRWLCTDAHEPTMNYHCHRDASDRVFLLSAIEHLSLSLDKEEEAVVAACCRLVVYNDSLGPRAELAFEAPCHPSSDKVEWSGVLVHSLQQSSNKLLPHGDTCQVMDADILGTAPLLYCWSHPDAHPHVASIGLIPRIPYGYDRHPDAPTWSKDVPAGGAVAYIASLSPSRRKEEHITNYVELWMGAPDAEAPDMVLTIVDPLVLSHDLVATSTPVCVSAAGGIRITTAVPPQALRFHGKVRLTACEYYYSALAIPTQQVWGWWPRQTDTSNGTSAMIALGGPSLGERVDSAHSASLLARGFGPFRVDECSSEVQADARARPGVSGGTRIIICGSCGYGGTLAGESFCSQCGATPAYPRSETVDALQGLRGRLATHQTHLAPGLSACMLSARQVAVADTRRNYRKIGNLPGVEAASLLCSDPAQDWHVPPKYQNRYVDAATARWRDLLNTEDTEDAKALPLAQREIWRLQTVSSVYFTVRQSLTLPEERTLYAQGVLSQQRRRQHRHGIPLRLIPQSAAPADASAMLPPCPWNAGNTNEFWIQKGVIIQYNKESRDLAMHMDDAHGTALRAVEWRQKAALRGGSRISKRILYSLHYRIDDAALRAISAQGLATGAMLHAIAARPERQCAWDDDPFAVPVGFRSLSNERAPQVFTEKMAQCLAGAVSRRLPAAHGRAGERSPMGQYLTVLRSSLADAKVHLEVQRTLACWHDLFAEGAYDARTALSELHRDVGLTMLAPGYDESVFSEPKWRKAVDRESAAVRKTLLWKHIWLYVTAVALLAKSGRA